MAERICTPCVAVGALLTLKALGAAALVENVIEATPGDVLTEEAGVAVRTDATGVAGGTTTDVTWRGGTTTDVTWRGGTTTDVTGVVSLVEEAATSTDGTLAHGAAAGAATADTAEAVLTEGTNGCAG